MDNPQLEQTLKWIVLASLIFWVLVISVPMGLAIKWFVDQQPPPETYQGKQVSSLLSPCQCRMQGGCSVMMSRPDLLFDDRTDPSDYDKWGGYHGQLNVPLKCRP